MTMLWFELISSIFMFLGVVLIIILAIFQVRRAEKEQREYEELMRECYGIVRVVDSDLNMEV